MISVVLASCRSATLLNEAVAALMPQCLASGAELIVARSDRGGVQAELPSNGGALVRCPAEASIPQIRGAGLAAARGDWVALTEDNCIARPDWLRELAQGFGGSARVVGGSMDNARPARAIDCGASYAEYGFFGSTAGDRDPEGATPLLTGANVAYHRDVVEDVASWALAGDWEDVIHQRLRTQGIEFSRRPAAVIAQNLEYRLRAFCLDRYQHGRDYARARSQALSAASRLVHAAATPLLPPVLASRIWASAGRAAPASFLRALPYTLGFLGAWAVGEAVGYLAPGSRK